MPTSDGPGGNTPEQDLMSQTNNTQQSESNTFGRELRSSSPAVKRPASDMGDDVPDEQQRDIDMETPSGSETADQDGAIDNTPKAKQHPRRPRHKRETSVDMIGQDDVSGPQSTSNSTTDETISSNTDSLYPTPSSISTYTASTRSSGIPRDSSGPGEEGRESRSEEPPSIDEQIAKVQVLIFKPLQEGQKGYAVSSSWLQRVMARSSTEKKDSKFDKSLLEGEIGPVDNTDLVLVTDPALGVLEDEAGEPYLQFRPNVSLNNEFEMVPQEAWDLIISWYGLAEGSPVITRYVHNTSTEGSSENNVYELSPPIFTILKLPSQNQQTTSKGPEEQRPVRFLASRSSPFNAWLKKAKQLAGIDLNTKVQVWRILGGLGGSGTDSGMMTPAASRSASPAPGAQIVANPGNRLVLDLNTFAGLALGSQREKVDAKDQTASEKYNGSSTLDMNGLGRDEVILLDEQIGGPGGGEWTSESVRLTKKNNNLSIPVSKSGSLPKSKAGNNGRSSPAPGSGIMTRGRQRRDGKPRGITGLSNLGNTCYMNSALQCIRSVEELTQYFLSEKYKADLNPDNPLGFHGDIAKAYANLLNQIYADSASASLPPRPFKGVIGRHGPSFSGYGQQDSQEFLGFLLDGLQEDLNRILKKPYIEKPDSTDEMVHDPAALQEFADKNWEIYKARNDSVVGDLFAGMYKSTLVCPVCDKVSIIFDPFNNLTLQLPVENLWSKDIFYFPLRQAPLRVSVDIDKNASILDLKEYVAARVGSDPKRLIMAEIYKHRFYKMFENIQTVAEAQIGSNDDIGIFEVESVPTNYFPNKRPKPRFTIGYGSNLSEDDEVPPFDSPKCDRMLVPIFNRFRKRDSIRNQKQLFGAPSYTIITREDALNIDAIMKKILAEVATMTTLDILNIDQDVSERESTTQEDPDTVLMNEEDYSSSDSKVQAGSVEGDDSLVDVSMRDDGDATQPPVDPAPKPQPHLPRVLQPDEYIPAGLQSMFEIKVFHAGNETVPIGWSHVDESKDFTNILSRLPAVQQQRSQARGGFINGDSSPNSSDEEVDDAPEAVNQQLPTNDDSDYETSSQPKHSESDNEDSEFPSVKRIINTNRYTGITYSKKGKMIKSKQQQPEVERGPLLRPGEGIVLDWTVEAYEALFSTDLSEANDMHGSGTWLNIELVPDPELEKKRRNREMRKKKGFSLDDCLDEFGKPEVLSENDAWYCPRCKEHRRASKKFELWKSPDILVIHFKRFSANRGFRDKIDLVVDFPVESLDLSQRVAMHEKDKGLIYDLIAVDNHYGGLGGGHYTAFAKNFIDGNWYDYNDSHVSLRKNPEVVVTSAAYLLFYRRRSEHPLGGPVLQEITEAAHKSPADSDSQNESRSGSPSGEGQHLDGSSRNGSSSALRGVTAGGGAAHQAGNGGSGASDRTHLGPLAKTSDDDDDLPPYHEALDSGETTLAPTIESGGMDLDEGLGGMYAGPLAFPPEWNFNSLSHGPSQMSHLPPGGDEEEHLFDDDGDMDSNKAQSSGGLSDAGANFDDDEGTVEGRGFDAGTPPRTNSPFDVGEGIFHEIPAPHDDDDDDDIPVVELQVGEK